MEEIIITAVVILAGLLASALYLRQLTKHKFQCEACSKEFNVKWSRLLYAVHFNDHYEIRCPYCNNKGCIEKKDK